MIHGTRKGPLSPLIISTRVTEKFATWKNSDFITNYTITFFCFEVLLTASLVLVCPVYHTSSVLNPFKPSVP